MRLTLLFHNPTSLWSFEVDRMAAWTVASPVEGHNDEAVLREGCQARHGAVGPIPRERQRVFVSVGFLRVHQAAQAPPVYLKQRTGSFYVVHLLGAARLWPLLFSCV